ncbi:MAG: hypothetical protein A2Z34_05310 [Planctomycetes bacterium RBG_16_59_8]|nr:MAG: hypothetical protein A2Z34_05310 [Planctomycetes bacterium RBG_16_59_8]
MQLRTIVCSSVLLLLTLGGCGGGAGTRGSDSSGDEEEGNKTPIRLTYFQILPDKPLTTTSPGNVVITHHTYQILASRAWVEKWGKDLSSSPFAGCGDPSTNLDVPDWSMEKALEFMITAGIRELPSRRHVDRSDILRRINEGGKSNRIQAIAVESPSLNVIILYEDIVTGPNAAKNRETFKKLCGTFVAIAGRFPPAEVRRLR